MYITIEKHEYDKIARAVIYELQIGIQHGQDIDTHLIRTRFSEMDRFDKAVRKTVTDLPQFPAKKWIGNTTEAFIKQRTEDLQKYIVELLRIPGITDNPEFQKLFDTSL